MRQDEAVTPINHTAGSEFATKAAGTAGGALKGGLMTGLLWIGGAALLGIAIAALVTSPAGLAGLIGSFGAAGVSGSGILGIISNHLVIGGVLGAMVGLGTVAIPAGLGAVAGGFGGHAKASNRVNNERAAAMEMQQAITMQQASAQGFAPAPANQYNFPAQGSAMNMAGGRISAAEYEGVAAGQQLQRA